MHDTHGGAAVANVPLLVKGGDKIPLPAAKTAQLPVVVYDEAGRSNPPYIPSGYMGAYQAIKMDENCTDHPHSGKTCIRADLQSTKDWGGVIWQSPANDWGDKPGGLDLTGATKLTFWARGDRGGEVVTFLVGIIKNDKPFFDTAQEKLDRVKLTDQWQQYTIDLKGKDLKRIKSGFGWTAASTGQPITFYLDDIRYE